MKNRFVAQGPIVGLLGLVSFLSIIFPSLMNFHLIFSSLLFSKIASPLYTSIYSSSFSRWSYPSHWTIFTSLVTTPVLLLCTFFPPSPSYLSEFSFFSSPGLLRPPPSSSSFLISALSLPSFSHPRSSSSL